MVFSIIWVLFILFYFMAISNVDYASPLHCTCFNLSDQNCVGSFGLQKRIAGTCVQIKFNGWNCSDSTVHKLKPEKNKVRVGGQKKTKVEKEIICDLAKKKTKKEWLWWEITIEYYNV